MVALTGQDRLASARRIVVKVGSSLLIDEKHQGLRRAWMASLAADIHFLRNEGREVLLVTSGAVGAGLQASRMDKARIRLEEAQALAAIGQVRIASAWSSAFEAHEIRIGQVLLTLEDTENRRRWLNCSATLTTLLQMGVVPLINENDSVASDEIRYGDNDRLAARTAQMVGADLLVLLSDVDGLYSGDPTQHANAVHIPLIEQITPEIVAMAGAPSSQLGTGGMATKIMAARIAGSAGCATLIANGQTLRPLSEIQTGVPCTLFQAPIKPAQARKNWIAGTVQPKGKIIIDAGAQKALAGGASLLAAGILEISGQFDRGEVVVIQDQNNLELARGMSAYTANEVGKIRGLKTEQIQAVLGYEARKAVIHRDNLVMGDMEPK